MPTPPPCRSLGAQCRELRLTLRIADLDEDTAAERDAAATWLLGHTERIAFGTPYVRDGFLLVEAVVRVPCKYLAADRRDPQGLPDGRGGTARCGAHGFRGPMPEPSARPAARRAFRHDDDTFTLVHRGRVRALRLARRNGVPRSLPVLGKNPCATARCRTADNTIGAACCRDLTLDVVAPLGDERTERFLRSRKAPYLCKVKRADETVVECEVISACGYLDPTDGVTCVLHDRVRPGGRPAKPDVCFDWPDFDKDDEDYAGHPGCVFLT